MCDLEVVVQRHLDELRPHLLLLRSLEETIGELEEADPTHFGFRVHVIDAHNEMVTIVVDPNQPLFVLKFRLAKARSGYEDASLILNGEQRRRLQQQIASRTCVER